MCSDCSKLVVVGNTAYLCIQFFNRSLQRHLCTYRGHSDRLSFSQHSTRLHQMWCKSELSWSKMTQAGGPAEGLTDTTSCVPARVWQKEVTKIYTGNVFTSTMSTKQNKHLKPGFIQFLDISSGIYANSCIPNPIMHYLLCKHENSKYLSLTFLLVLL